MKQFILIINGPITGGKTSVIEAIKTHYKKVFILSANKIKFSISDYTPDRDRVVVHECVVLIAERMLQAGMSLILEGGSITQGDLNNKLKKLAQKYELNITVVNIEAPLSVLKNRFEERILESSKKNKKLSVIDMNGFMERYNAYLGIKNEAIQTFDSNTLDPEEISQRIMALI